MTENDAESTATLANEKYEKALKYFNRAAHELGASVGSTDRQNDINSSSLKNALDQLRDEIEAMLLDAIEKAKVSKAEETTLAKRKYWNRFIRRQRYRIDKIYNVTFRLSILLDPQLADLNARLSSLVGKAKQKRAELEASLSRAEAIVEFAGVLASLAGGVAAAAGKSL